MYIKLKELFRKNKALLKRGIFFRRMLLLYTVCTTIVFVGFGIAMSLSLQKDHQNQISKLNERALFQSASTCSTTLENLYNYFYMQILESPELIKILVENNYSQKLSISFWEMNQKLINYSNEEYDKNLVIRMVEKITVYEDKFTVEFKSGTSVDVER